MKKILFVVAAACCVLIPALGALSLTGRFAPPALDCMKTGEAVDHFDILVVGESWAAGGRFFPELPQTLSERIKKPVHACSIGFSGRNTRLLNKEIRAQYPIDKIKGLFEGRLPNSVIILNGVNDVIEHVGTNSYSDETAALVDYFKPSSVQVVSIPRVNEVTLPRSVLSAGKRWLQAIWYDGGQIQANDSYREALRKKHPNVKTINFDEFIPSYEGHEDQFTPDGIHLVLPAFKSYGYFLGSRVDVPAPAVNSKPSSTKRSPRVPRSVSAVQVPSP